jgi:RNA polymerase sigma-70 factor (ECF subfamily)
LPIHLEDRKLAKRLLAGEEQAFNRFFEDHFSRLYRFALARLAGDSEAAGEVAQAALSRALRKIHSYRGEAALFTWLCAICRNEITDRARRDSHYHRHIVLTEDRPEIQAAIDSFQTPASEEPGSQYQKYEALRLIHVALDQLPPNYGNALEWKYIEGHSVREISRRLGTSFEAAQSLLARARRSFEEIYSTLAQSVLETES